MSQLRAQAQAYLDVQAAKRSLDNAQEALRKIEDARQRSYRRVDLVEPRSVVLDSDHVVTVSYYSADQMWKYAVSRLVSE